MNHKAVLIPYWLNEAPTNLSKSDNGWWFAPLLKYDILVFAGPYLKDTNNEELDNSKVIQIRTNALNFTLREIDKKLSTNNTGISLNNISMIWNVIEMSPTCRVQDLNCYKGTKVALIGDTHHLKNPISSLLPYIRRSEFDFVFCTQSHHSFMFEAGVPYLKVYSFPYSMPKFFNNNKVISYINNENIMVADAPLYRGSIMSRFHYRRTKLINFLLINTDIVIKERMNWDAWVESLYSENHRLVISTINGNFSPQIMYPLLYGKTCFVDNICELNWLGELITKKELCYTHRNKYECLRNIKSMQSKQSNLAIEEERMMQIRATKNVQEKLNSLCLTQEAFKDIKGNISWLKNLRTAKEVELGRYIISEKQKKPSLGKEIIYYFEAAQEVYNYDIQPGDNIRRWVESMPESISAGIKQLLPTNHVK